MINIRAVINILCALLIFLEPLSDFSAKVVFKESNRVKAQDGDECIIGLDVGSTTTKAVLIRTKDDGIVASIYLRTDGNPIGRCTLIERILETTDPPAP